MPTPVASSGGGGSDKRCSASPLTQQPPQGCKARGLCCGEQRAELLRGEDREHAPARPARHRSTGTSSSAGALPAPPGRFLQPARPSPPALRPVQASACGRASSPLPERERLHPAWPGQCCSVISSLISHDFVLPGWSADVGAASPEQVCCGPARREPRLLGPRFQRVRQCQRWGLPAATGSDPLPPAAPPAAPISSQGHRVWSVGTGALGRAISEQRMDAGLCFPEDGQRFPLLQRHMEKN